MTMTMDETKYRAYVDNVNRRNFEPADFEPYLHDKVVINGHSITREQFSEGIAKHLGPFPEAVIHIELLAVQGDLIASRVMIRNGDKDGIEIDGQHVVHEHCFYKTSGGRIEEFWIKR
jgi:predicted ester cyclase